jgi:hypothetical protein
MPFPIIGAIGAGLEIGGNIFAGIQGARLGKKQMQMGQQMRQEGQEMSAANQRPEMQTPQAYQQMMRMMQGGQFEQMPGMQMAQNQIAQATAGGIGAMERRGTGAEAFGGISQLYGQQMGQQRGLAQEQAQFQEGRRGEYLQGLEGLGGLQQQQWQWEQADPYMQAQQQAAMLQQQGRQGEWEGMKTKMGSWAEAFSGAGGAAAGMGQQLQSAFPGGFGGGEFMA